MTIRTVSYLKAALYMILKNIILLSLINMSLFQAHCFAEPSEHLLIKLSRNAVELRKNGLPVLLTAESKNASFIKVVRDTLGAIETETYPGVEQDKNLLNLFLQHNRGMNCVACDQSVHKLTQNLLFRRANTNLEWLKEVGVVNPSYRAVLDHHPEAVLNHDINIRYLPTLLSQGKVGLDEQEVNFKNSPIEATDAFSNSLRGKGATTSTHGTFVQFSNNQSQLDQIQFFSTEGVRLILKNDLLKRWDFYMTNNWAGGKFVTQDAHPDDFSYKRRSFGPGEIDQFISYRDSQTANLDLRDPNTRNWTDLRDEIIFFNPIPNSEIKEIQVNHQGVETIKKLLKKLKLDIPVRGVNSSTNPGWDQEVANQVMTNLEATNPCSPSLPIHPEAFRFTEVQAILDKINSDPEIQAHFESLDPAIQKENHMRLWNSYDKKDLKFLEVKTPRK